MINNDIISKNSLTIENLFYSEMYCVSLPTRMLAQLFINNDLYMFLNRTVEIENR